MNDLIAKLKQPSLWTISVQLLVLYVVSVAVFFGLHAVAKKVEGAVKDRVAKGEAGPSAGILLLTSALNFAGVLAIVLVTKKTGENIRMAMIGVPLFLIVEQHVRQLRNHPEERRLQLLGMTGVIAGICSAVAVFMPHAPLK